MSPIADINPTRMMTGVQMDKTSSQGSWNSQDAEDSLPFDTGLVQDLQASQPTPMQLREDLNNTLVGAQRINALAQSQARRGINQGPEQQMHLGGHISDKTSQIPLQKPMWQLNRPDAQLGQ